MLLNTSELNRKDVVEDTTTVDASQFYTLHNGGSARPENPDIPFSDESCDPVKVLKQELNEVKCELQMLRDTLLPLLSQILENTSVKSEPSVKESDLVPNQALFMPILALAKEGAISARTASVLDCAGIKYVSDFQYITLNELSQLNIKDKELSALFELLEDRFSVHVTNSRRICSQFHTNDLVRFLPATSNSLEQGQTLIVTAVDYSPILPKYTCTTRNKEAHCYILSPSVLTEATF